MHLSESYYMPICNGSLDFVHLYQQDRETYKVHAYYYRKIVSSIQSGYFSLVESNCMPFYALSSSFNIGPSLNRTIFKTILYGGSSHSSAADDNTICRS